MSLNTTTSEDLLKKVISKRLERKRSELDNLECKWFKMVQNGSKQAEIRKKIVLNVQIQEIESLIDILECINGLHLEKSLDC